MDDIKTLRKQTGVGLTKCKEALETCKGNLEEAVVYLRKLGLASVGKKESRETKEGIIFVKSNDQGTAVIEVNVETDFVANNAVFRSFVEDLSEEILHHKSQDLEFLVQQTFSKDPSLTIDEQRAVVMQTVGENIRLNRALYLSKSDSESHGVYSHGNGKTVSLVILSGSNAGESLAKDIAMHVVASNPEFLNQDSVPEDVLERERNIISSQMEGKPKEIIEKIITGKLNSFFQENCLLNQAFIKNPDQTIQQLLDLFSKQNGTPVKVSNFMLWKIGT